MRWLPVLLLAACGAAAPAPARSGDPPADDGGPFARAEGFEPVAFGVEVHGEGRPVILIPGIGCPGAVWDDTVAHLANGYQTHVLTLSGFAGRPAIDEPLSAAVRRDLTRYIRSRRLRAPIVIGHSMGGFIAYWLAARHPDLVGPVIIVDAGPALSGDRDEARGLRAKWHHVTDDQFTALVRAAFSSMTRRPRKMAPVIDRVARSDPRVFGDAIFEMMTTDLTAEVRDIEAPVLIVAADGGLQGRIRAQVAAIPHHEMVVVRGTRHFVMFDDPPAFFATIDRFLAAHPAPRRDQPAPPNT